MEAYWDRIIAIIGLLVFPFLYFVWSQLKTLRQNDIHELRVALNRIEVKLDEHLQWHSHR